MAETRCNIRNYEVLTARLDPTEVRGTGSSYRPILQLPFKLQVMPTKGDRGEMNYVLLRLAGTVSSPSISEFAEFEAAPIVEESRPDAHYFRQVDVRIPLDHRRIRQFEDARSGANATLTVNLSALLWFPEDQTFQKTYSNRPLEVIVPRSTWADEVLSRWGLSTVKLVEVRFPATEIGDTFRAAYNCVEGAEKFFANGDYKQVLTELRLGFEGLAKGVGFEGKIKEALEHLLGDLVGERKEKAREAALNLYRFLHLGPHDHTAPNQPPDEPTILRRDARFALVTTLAVLEYITPAR